MLRRLCHCCNVRMRFQELPKRFAENAHSGTMDHSHARQTREKRSVDEFFHFASGIVDGLADHVDFPGYAELVIFIL